MSLPHLWSTASAATVLLAGLVLPAAATASPSVPGAAPTTATAVIGEVVVTPTDGLPEQGAIVTVTGTGFDPAAGIYVAVCVDNGPGVKPSPCIGGADTEGIGGAVWVSDNPPAYAEGLTRPYGPGGSFEIELPVPVSDDVTGVDCREVTCAVTVRYDHTRGEDRGADHVVPVTFATDTGSEADATEPDAPASESGEQDDAEGGPDPATAVQDDLTSDDSADQDPDTTTAPATPTVLIAAAAVLAVLVAGALVVRRRARRTLPDPTRPDPSAGPPPPES